MRTADLHHRVPRLRLPQHPQNLLFAVSSLAHTGSPLLLPENHNRPIPQLSIGLVFGFWVSTWRSFSELFGASRVADGRRDRTGIALRQGEFPRPSRR